MPKFAKKRRKKKVQNDGFDYWDKWGYINNDDDDDDTLAFDGVGDRFVVWKKFQSSIWNNVYTEHRMLKIFFFGWFWTSFCRSVRSFIQ